MNPYYIRCNNNKCRKKKNLRTYSFMNKIKNIPASVCFMILENFFIIGLNAIKFTKAIKEKYNKIIKEIHIQKILEFIRKIIYVYMKNKYNTTLIGGFDNEGNQKIAAIDESLFVHEGNLQIWVIGGIETKYRRIRREITLNRIAQTIEEFIYNNFKEGVHFTHDGWTRYNFLKNNINYSHESHNHERSDFGEGYHSTSHIESLWAYLKKILTTLYSILPGSYFKLFLREAELRYNI